MLSEENPSHGFGFPVYYCGFQIPNWPMWLTKILHTVSFLRPRFWQLKVVFWIHFHPKYISDHKKSRKKNNKQDGTFPVGLKKKKRKQTSELSHTQPGVLSMTRFLQWNLTEGQGACLSPRHEKGAGRGSPSNHLAVVVLSDRPLCGPVFFGPPMRSVFSLQPAFLTPLLAVPLVF